MKKTTISLAVLSAVALSGCGADEPYKEAPKSADLTSVQSIKDAATDTTTTATEATTNTSLSDLAVHQPERKFLYTRSMGDAPRYVASIQGMVQGTPKLVTLRMTKNGIQLRQLDRDTVGEDHLTREDSEYNKAPVLTIPGDYVDYQCEKDNWNDCTNREEEVNDNSHPDIKWDQRKYFVPHFEQAKIAEETASDLIHIKDCAIETEKTRLVRDGDWKGYEMNLKDGVINFEIEHTYQASSACFGAYYQGNLDNLSFTTTEYISIVALDKLTSKDYVSVPYSTTANGTFGFFRNKVSYRDENENSGKEGYVRQYLNRFNPKKEEITYYLSNNFYEAKNKSFLDAAHESIDAMNIQNKMFKTGLPTIKLEQAHGHRHGDLRYNNITLFDEPLDNGLAGYGPLAANPLTGETVSARVDQYSANLRRGSSRYYRRVMFDYNRGKLDAASVKALTGVDYKTAPAIAARAKAVSTNNQVAQAFATQHAGDSYYVQPRIEPEVDTNTATVLPTALNQADSQNKTLDQLAADKDKTEQFWAEHNLMSVDEAFGVGNSSALRNLPRGVKGHEINWKDTNFWVGGKVGGKLKEIEDIPQALRTDLINKLATEAFQGTLTHELGHDFGLRHNFAGSRDQGNFFSAKELEAQHKAFAAAGYPNLSAKADFSSQMDYNSDRFATTYEKYDLAALRFGYAREVEDTNGNWISLKDEDAKRRAEFAKGETDGPLRFGALDAISQTHDLHTYAFCTDEHRELNSNCNWFDSGTNNDDIEKNWVDEYNDSYVLQNLRHNRDSFTEFDMSDYALSRLREFDKHRAWIEEEYMVPDILGVDTDIMVGACDQSPSIWWCASVRAADQGANLLLKAAGLNDIILTSTWVDKSDPTTPKHVIQHPLHELLSNTYMLSNNLMDANFDIGNPVSSYQENKAKIDDLLIKDDQRSFDGIKEDYSNYQVKITVSDGHLLNSLKAPHGNPNHPFLNDRDVLGMWPDKLLAVRDLVKRMSPRDSSTRVYHALVDNPKVAAKFKAMLCHMTVGPDVLPSMIPDTCGNEDKGIFNNDADYADQYIEGLPSFNTYVGKYFGFSQVLGQEKGEANLLQMMLKQVALASHDSDYRGAELARVWREYVGMHLATTATAVKSSDPKAYRNVTVHNKIYMITKENVLAGKLLDHILKIGDTAKMMTMLGMTDLVDSALQPMVDRDLRVLSYLPVLKD